MYLFRPGFHSSHSSFVADVYGQDVAGSPSDGRQRDDAHATGRSPAGGDPWHHADVMAPIFALTDHSKLPSFLVDSHGFPMITVKFFSLYTFIFDILYIFCRFETH